jgi:ABC-2 type transport system ATP-binding protein
MDDLEALCSEVTIVSTGRVVFSGPLDKLADASRELDYRLVTSDHQAAPCRPVHPRRTGTALRPKR